MRSVRDCYSFFITIGDSKSKGGIEGARTDLEGMDVGVVPSIFSHGHGCRKEGSCLGFEVEEVGRV